jgi:hypothetical protein
LKVLFLVPYFTASWWEKIGRPFQATGLGCEKHSTLVSTKAQPGEAQYPDEILWEHVSCFIFFPFWRKNLPQSSCIPEGKNNRFTLAIWWGNSSEKTGEQ